MSAHHCIIAAASFVSQASWWSTTGRGPDLSKLIRDLIFRLGCGSPLSRVREDQLRCVVRSSPVTVCAQSVSRRQLIGSDCFDCVAAVVAKPAIRQSPVCREPISNAPSRYSSPTDISVGARATKVKTAFGHCVHTSMSALVIVTKPKVYVYRPGSVTRPILSQVTLLTRNSISFHNKERFVLVGSCAALINIKAWGTALYSKCRRILPKR